MFWSEFGIRCGFVLFKFRKFLRGSDFRHLIIIRRKLESVLNRYDFDTMSTERIAVQKYVFVYFQKKLYG